MRKFASTICITVTVAVTFCFGQDIKFSASDFETLVKYCRSNAGSIPVLSADSTLDAVKSFRAKLDSVALGKRKIEQMRFTALEANIALYIMREDVAAAARLLMLQQKLTAFTKPKIATRDTAKFSKR